MPTESVIEVVVNLKTRKLFILLDETNERYQIISPTGETMNLPITLFEEEPLILEEHDFASKLAEEQIAAWYVAQFTDGRDGFRELYMQDINQPC